MTGPKPLVFDNKTPAPPAKVAPGPSPLFAQAKEVSASSPKSSSAPPPAVKRLSFDNVVTPVAKAPAAVAQPRPALATVSGTNDATVLRAIEQAHPDLYRQEKLRLTRQVQELFPLRIGVVLNWGTKTLERMRDGSREVTALVSQFSQARGAELIEQAKEMMNPPKGVVARLKQKLNDPLSFKPNLQMLNNQLVVWLTECDELIKKAKANHCDVLLKEVSFSAVVNYVGTIADNALDSAVANRRTILTQGCMQADLAIQQLQEVRGLIITQRMGIEHLLNVALPAYEMANARK